VGRSACDHSEQETSVDATSLGAGIEFRDVRADQEQRQKLEGILFRFKSIYGDSDEDEDEDEDGIYCGYNSYERYYDDDDYSL
jgi:hypothetical protein